MNVLNDKKVYITPDTEIQVFTVETVFTQSSSYGDNGDEGEF